MPLMAAMILGSCEVSAIPEAVAPARHWLSRLLTADYSEIVDDVVLLACEAITNAVLHSDSAESGKEQPITVAVLDVGDAVRVEVTDAGSTTSVPRLIEDGPDALNGRGLHMLDMLSEGRWDSYPDGDGRTLWFEVATDGKA